MRVCESFYASIIFILYDLRRLSIWSVFLGILAFAQPPLKKPNTFRLESLVREGEEELLIRYEIPFEGVVELRLIGEGNAVVYFYQWPSAPGVRQRRLPGAKGLRGIYRYRITYKGRDYEGQITL